MFLESIEGNFPAKTSQSFRTLKQPWNQALYKNKPKHHISVQMKLCFFSFFLLFWLKQIKVWCNQWLQKCHPLNHFSLTCAYRPLNKAIVYKHLLFTRSLWLTVVGGQCNLHPSLIKPEVSFQDDGVWSGRTSPAVLMVKQRPKNQFHWVRVSTHCTQHNPEISFKYMQQL